MCGVLFLFLAYVQFITNMSATVVLVLCYMFASGGANQSDLLLDSGMTVNAKITYVLQGVDFHFVLA